MGVIQNDRELEFAIFCIENIAIRLGIYDALTIQSDVLNEYIVPCYDILHTQDKNYIVNDIMEVMRGKGVVL